MGYGFYVSFTGDTTNGLYYLIAGAVVLIIFAWFLVKEFERIR
jgi:LPXTG-motif cell wall-anchored protein